MLALLSSVGNVSVFINSFNRSYLGSASWLAASRKAPERMVEGPNGLNFPRAKSALRHSNCRRAPFYLDNEPGKLLFCNYVFFKLLRASLGFKSKKWSVQWLSHNSPGYSLFRYGVIDDETGEWNGMVAEILSGRADIAVAGMTRNFDREKVYMP